MVKYFFSVSYGDHWLQTAIKLKKNNIAKPVLWLGDNVHYLKAKEAFGEVVLNMETFVHHPFDIKKIEYNGELCNFFDSLSSYIIYNILEDHLVLLYFYKILKFLLMYYIYNSVSFLYKYIVYIYIF